jgi:hypothetical protein
MPSGVIRLRNSKKSQQNPRVGHEQQDISGYRGTGTRDDTANVNAGSHLAPRKPDTFDKHSDVTRVLPKASDRGVGKEGKKRAHAQRTQQTK